MKNLFEHKDIYDNIAKEYVNCYRVLAEFFPIWLEAKPEEKGGNNRIFGLWITLYTWYCNIWMTIYYFFGGDKTPESFAFMPYLKGENYITAMWRKIKSNE